MWYAMGFIAVIYLGNILTDIYKELRSKNPEYQNELVIKEQNERIRKQEVKKFMQDHIGNRVKIQSDELALIGVSKLVYELKRVEEDWVELYSSEKKKTLLVKNDEIKDVELVK